MADIYMHSKMAEAVMKQWNKPLDKGTLFMGAQSSDPMYYATFHKDAKQYRYYADRMHDTDTQKLLIHLVNYVKQHHTLYTYSFVVGFICHYSLDVHIHPYVYHHVGIYNKKDPKTYPLRGLHLKFERSIDCVLMEDDLQIPSRKMNLTRYYFPIKVPHPDVSTMMQSSFKNQFDIDNGNDIFNTSVKHMYNVIRFMTTDRFGIKKQLYKFVDLFRTDQDLFMADLSFFNHVEDYDFLNKTNRTWQHPVTGESFTKSVNDLYNEAITFAVNILRKVDTFLAGEEIDLKQVFTNLSFNSGVECTASYPFQFIQPYRP